MPSPFSQHPNPPSSDLCFKAHKVLCEAYKVCDSFHSIFAVLRKSKSAGNSTDFEQDTLRAMLVFAGAGLDSSLKQLVQDTLKAVIDKDDGAQKNFTESVRRKLPDMERGRDLLAGVLTARDPRSKLIDTVISDLVADSLQSFAQLSKAAAAFSIPSDKIGNSLKLKDAFDARNQIIHEMDINFQANRKRRQRKQADMESHAKAVLHAASAFLDQVDEKIAP